MEKTKVFSKERWLVSALGDKDKGLLTQKESMTLARYG